MEDISAQNAEPLGDLDKEGIISVLRVREYCSWDFYSTKIYKGLAAERCGTALARWQDLKVADFK